MSCRADVSTAVSDESDAGAKKPPAKKAAVSKAKPKAPAKKIETVMELDDPSDDDSECSVRLKVDCELG